MDKFLRCDAPTAEGWRRPGSAGVSSDEERVMWCRTAYLGKTGASSRTESGEHYGMRWRIGGNRQAAELCATEVEIRQVLLEG